MLQNWLKCNTLIKNRTFYLINSCRSIQGNLGLQRRFNHQAVSTASPLPYSVFALVKEYRRCGHFLSKLDPLNQDVTNLAEKETQSLRQSIQWMERCLAENHEVKVRSLRDQLQHLGGYEHISPERLLSHLKSLYSSEVGVQFDHLSDESERAWAYDNWETKYSQYLSSSPDASQTLNTAKLMLNCEAFDEFLALRFPSVKRYGCEGAESMLVFFDQLFTVAGQSTRYRQTDFVLAMPHRGRLNLLALQLNMSEELIFRKLMGHAEFDLSEMSQITGDVISHLFTSIDLNSLPVSNQVHVSLLPNPSHLEAISPVACGKSRARQKRLLSGPYSGERPSEIDVLPIQVHGDGSFSGQGIIFEELQFAHLPQYTNNGSIHLIVNNQIAYTMEGKCRDSSLRYPSNVMQAVDCPVLHVNGSKPHAIRCAVDFAIDYRNEFGKDVLIDLHCYRQHGHNELDDPTFTNPRLYDHIRGRQYTIPMEYAIEQACLSESEANTIKKVYKEKLDESLKRTKQNISNPSPTTNPTVKTLQNQWSNMRFPMAGQLTTWNTGLDPQLIQYLGLRSLDIPANFTLHKNLRRILFRDRRNKIRTGLNIDWSLAESLAFASLLYQGYDVRISGQDVGRGTFSQRHMVLVDQQTEETIIPLNRLQRKYDSYAKFERLCGETDINLDDLNDDSTYTIDSSIGSLEVANSILSESAVLSYEFGYSLESPRNLVIWEAQFGDFFNGAQIAFDTLIGSAECKWALQSGLVCLLPHGFDGAGPEHSTCRLERFLQLSNSHETSVDDERINWHVVFPTTPAQYYHLLRRQMLRNQRRPLIVAAPKGLLRDPKCVSTFDDMKDGTHFEPILDDSLLSTAKRNQANRIVFCSGKHYYALDIERQKRQAHQTALVRVEELTPFPSMQLANVLKNYPKATEFVWAQEEPRNQGAWSFVSRRFENLLNISLRYAGRPESACPAVGIAQLHKNQVQQLIDDAFPK